MAGILENQYPRFAGTLKSEEHIHIRMLCGKAHAPIPPQSNTVTIFSIMYIVGSYVYLKNIM